MPPSTCDIRKQAIKNYHQVIEITEADFLQHPPLCLFLRVTAMEVCRKPEHRMN